MPNRLAAATSPYLLQHADNPVDWHPWGQDAFDEAARRQVPLFVSIGYSTCHWCHVMARESFSDPDLAAYLNAHFVAVKVDREEHPDVDASYLAAASAFTPNLGWPLSVFATPAGRAFFAGTYFPPETMAGSLSFRQVLEAVTEAWTERRVQVEDTAGEVAGLISKSAGSEDELPDGGEIERVIARLAEHEDTEFGGFGGAPKFPVAPVLTFLLAVPGGRALAVRTLRSMASSGLRDPIEGGFFRYATQRDWSRPHYERMLYDNAVLLACYADAWALDPAAHSWAADAAEGIADFLLTILRVDDGMFASAQDSESTVDGARVEGGYYALSAERRAQQQPPARDEKVLTGWNGLAIRALAHAGFVLDRPAWIDAARAAAEALLRRHLREDGTLVRMSIGDRLSAAPATLEDYGMFAGALLELALVTGEASLARQGRMILDAVITAGPGTDGPFAVPGGADPVLVVHGLAGAQDPSEGAYPSGLSACADAADVLYLLTGQRSYLEAAQAAMRTVAAHASANPVSFGAALRAMAALADQPEQLVLVRPDGDAGADDDLLTAVRRRQPPTLIAVAAETQTATLAAEGFELFAERTARDGRPTAYLCRNFVCRLPVTDPADLPARA